MLKKISIYFIFAALFFSLVACSNESDTKDIGSDERVLEAIEILSEHWDEVYTKNDIEDKHLEIINTRIVNIKENNIDGFENVDYIVEFSLFSNFYNTTPYYSDIGMDDSVIVYKNGKTEVSRINPFIRYKNTKYTSDFSDIIDSIEELHQEYNQVIEFK